MSIKLLLKDALEFSMPWLPPLIGGAIDYANQVQRGHKKWRVGYFLVHLASALFFGWVSGRLAVGAGYGTDITAAAGGLGGFFGVRVADFISYAAAQYAKKG